MLKKMFCVLIVVGTLFLGHVPNALASSSYVNEYLKEICQYYANGEMSTTSNGVVCSIPADRYDYYAVEEWSWVCTYEGDGVAYGPIPLGHELPGDLDVAEISCVTKA